MMPIVQHKRYKTLSLCNLFIRKTYTYVKIISVMSGEY